MQFRQISYHNIPKHSVTHECPAENHDMLMGSILQCLQLKERLLRSKRKKDSQGREMHLGDKRLPSRGELLLIKGIR